MVDNDNNITEESVSGVRQKILDGKKNEQIRISDYFRITCEVFLFCDSFSSSIKWTHLLEAVIES